MTEVLIEARDLVRALNRLLRTAADVLDRLAEEREKRHA